MPTDLEDNSLMPWGEHKGTKMENVPAKYLIFLNDSGKLRDPRVKNYIIENLEVLKKEVAEWDT